MFRVWMGDDGAIQDARGDQGVRYLGGKNRIRKHLVPVIQSFVTDRYAEPFCGACWVGELIQAPVRIMTDLNAPLIEMWKALQKGWIPPNEVSEELYQECKRGNQPQYMMGFVGFACSFGGKYFGGYARSGDRNYASNGSNSLLRRIPNLETAVFGVKHYSFVLEKMRAGDVCYCDPPYLGTTKYYDLPEMDYAEFWDWCRKASQRGVIVLVSEYQAPEDFVSVLDIETKTDLCTKEGKGARVERLFKYVKT